MTYSPFSQSQEVKPDDNDYLLNSDFQKFLRERVDAATEIDSSRAMTYTNSVLDLQKVVDDVNKR